MPARVSKNMNSVLIASDLQWIGLLIASLCLTACCAALLAMRDQH